MANETLFLAGYDPTYFTDARWIDRVDRWLAEDRANQFVSDNVAVIRGAAT